MTAVPFVMKFQRIAKKIKRVMQKPGPTLFASESFISYVLKKKNGYEQNVRTIRTLTLGASNADYGFYSPAWADSYNLGLTSCDLFTCYHLYKTRERELSSLENIVLFFGVYSPGFSLIHSDERYRTVIYNYFFQQPYENAKEIDSKLERFIKRGAQV